MFAFEVNLVSAGFRNKAESLCSQIDSAEMSISCERLFCDHCSSRALNLYDGETHSQVDPEEGGAPVEVMACLTDVFLFVVHVCFTAPSAYWALSSLAPCARCLAPGVSILLVSSVYAVCLPSVP
jgi:hypothetical protein